MTAGVRKIPPPIVEPTSTATALQKPSRRGIDEYRIDLGVERQMMALAKLLVGVAVAAGDALDQSNIWRLRTGHSEPSEGGPDDSWRSGRPGRASTGYGEGGARRPRASESRRAAQPAT